MADYFKDYRAELDSPYAEAADVTPDDSTDLAYVTRAIYVGGAGDVEVNMMSGSNVTFSDVPVGSTLYIRAARVLASGTTATNLIALW